MGRGTQTSMPARHGGNKQGGIGRRPFMDGQTVQARASGQDNTWTWPGHEM